MTLESVAVFLFVAYLAAAVGGFITSGAAENLFVGPPGGFLRGVGPATWRGAWWFPGRILCGLFLLLLAWNLSLLFLAIFLLSSPLWALHFVNALTGRPAPHGRMARWYEGVANRLRNRPRSCPVR
jgi:hypothetical protein